MKQKMFIAGLLIMLLVGMVSAEFTGLQQGVVADGKTIITKENGSVFFKDTQSQLSLLTSKDGAIPVGDNKILYSAIDPAISVTRTYTQNAVKEEIILIGDKALSFPITLPPDTKMIPWYNNQWKIVSASSGDTMNGIIIEKPYGIDADKHVVDMNYDYTGGELKLEYSRILKIYNKTKTEAANEFDKDGFPIPKFSDVPIKYPLVIDPSWISVGGCWTARDGNYIVIMWNTSGTTTWQVPVSNLSVQYLVVAGGGGGGSGRGAGGGAGGFRNGTALPVSGTETIVVGAGGSAGVAGRGGMGVNSSLTNDGSIIVSDGGGGGGSVDTTFSGLGGGSGGGAVNLISDGGTPGVGKAGQGRTGGYGNKTAPNYGGGGGGGNSTIGYNGTWIAGGGGGFGGQSSITGTLTNYAGGGGGGTYVGGTAGVGGAGGGGAGGVADVAGTAGTAGTGGGGGGGGYGTISQSGGAGGSGIVVVRFRDYSPISIFSNPLGYILADGADNKIHFLNFLPPSDGAYIQIIISGDYEVA